MDFNFKKAALSCAETVIQVYISSLSLPFEDIQNALDVFSYCNEDVQSHFDLSADEMWEYFNIKVDDANESDYEMDEDSYYD